MHTIKAWTPDEVAELRRLHAEGLNDGDIARRLARTGASVTNKRAKIGLQRQGAGSKGPTGWRAKLRDLVGMGLSDPEIAKRVNASASYVCKARSRYGIKSQWVRPKEPPQHSMEAPVVPAYERWNVAFAAALAGRQFEDRQVRPAPRLRRAIATHVDSASSMGWCA